MLSKLFNVRIVPLLRNKINKVLNISRRPASDILPPTQYDSGFPPRLNIFFAIRKNYELIPLLLITLFQPGMAVGSIVSALKNKVDVAFTRQVDDTISRTMNLRRPTVHKLITINQEYHPWPEMQDVLDRMKEAERNIQLKGTSCWT